MTGYERSSVDFYSGKLAMYGETVLGGLKTSLKRDYARSSLSLLDKDALAVRDDARAHPFEDADPSSLSAQAGEPALAAQELGDSSQLC